MVSRFGSVLKNLQNPPWFGWFCFAFWHSGSSISVWPCQSHAAQHKATPCFAKKMNDFDISSVWKDSSLSDSFSGEGVLCGKGGWEQHFDPGEETSRTVFRGFVLSLGGNTLLLSKTAQVTECVT